jgi:glycosyltransferase involved in cell wall biosynthesis
MPAAGSPVLDASVFFQLNATHTIIVNPHESTSGPPVETLPDLNFQDQSVLPPRSEFALQGVDIIPLVKETNLPFVSAVVPCRNEEKHIARCLDSLAASDYPRERLEILVLDGRSEDKTRAIVAEYSRHHPHIRLLDNPRLSIPAAMNIATRAATGEVIIKIDAHSGYRPNHIRDCIKYQAAYGAENVGGVCKMLPGASTAMAQAIALGMASQFGSGNALVKTSADRPTWADSVAFGCYRKDLLSRLGGFNEQLTGSSDMDLNYRIRAAGGRILLVPEIVVEYVADATLKALGRHTFADGVWATYVLKFKSKAWSWRHWVPLAFVVCLIAALALELKWPGFTFVFLAILGVYFAANVATSFYWARRKRDWKILFLLPAVFATRHFSHGLGALYGALLVPLPGVFWKGRRRARA